MATALKLRNDIKKLKAAIDRKGTPANILPKLKSQLEKAENELAAMKKGGKPRKVSTTKSTASTLQKLKAMVNKKGSKFSSYKGSGVDLERDAAEGAMPIGKRISKGLRANGVSGKGGAKKNVGNVYYEYRVNRLDVKQPKKKQTYPKLEDGGMMAKGGKIKDQYAGKIASEVWEKWTEEQRSHFLLDHSDLLDNDRLENNLGYSRTAQKDKKYEDLTPYTKRVLAAHVNSGQYASGGMMADGGGISSPRVKVKLYPHTTGGGAEYLTPKKHDFKNSEFIVRLDGTPYILFGESRQHKVKLYPHTTGGGAEYLMPKKHDFKNSQFIVRLDGSPYLLHDQGFSFMKYGGMMADGGETEEEEQKVIRGYSDDEPYEYAQGGELRKIKGNNFGQQIENGQKFKALIQKVYDDQQGDHKYPIEFIKATALTTLPIVKSDGKNYLKGYTYKGTLTHFEFLNDANFVKALEYVDRPAIKSFKFEDGGHVMSKTHRYDK